MPPVKPMLAKAVHAVPHDPGLLFEPKWDGFRCIVFRDGDELELGSRNDRPLTRYFPELVDLLRSALPDRCVVDGEVVVVTGTPFRERRQLLEGILGGHLARVHLTPITDDPAVAQDWFTRFEGAGFDGVMAKPADSPYQQDKRVMWKVKHERTADCVVAGFRWHKDGEGVGSLLLGLHDDDGTLHHVGVASSFTAARRRELVDELAPLREGALDAHPWRDWAEAASDAREEGRMPGGVSRWNAKKDLSWEPLRTELVAEVRYEHVMAGRFRHGGRLVRFRPDRSPESCTYAQLEEVAPAELSALFG